MRKQIKTMATTIPDINAHIIIGKDRISGYLVDKTNVALDHIEKIRRSVTYHRPEEIDGSVNKLITKLEKEYYKKNAPTKDHNKTEDQGIFSYAYSSVDNPSNLDGDWAASTSAKNHAYFVRHVLPALDQLDLTGDIESQLSAISDQIIKDTHASKKSIKTEQTTEGAMSKIVMLNTILSNLLALFPDLPPIQLPVGEHKRVKRREQLKFLLDEWRVRISHILLDEAAAVDLALAAALMFCGGLRTGEAAAVKLGDIKVVDDRYCSLFIAKRLDNKGEITHNLKTANAYRMIILPYYFLCLYIRRIEYLLGIGISQEQINDMPVCDLKGRNASELSKYFRQVFVRSGISAEQLDSIRPLMAREPDIVDGVRETDISAYILRRDWAGRMANVCAMSAEDVDYYLGHGNRDVKSAYYLDAAKSAETARLMERYVYLPECSLNPAYSPIVLTKPQDIVLGIGIGYMFKNCSNKKIVVTVRTLSPEPGSASSFDSPKRPRKLTIKGVPETVDERGTRPIIGPGYANDHYKGDVEK